MVSDFIMPPIGLLLGNVDFAKIFVLLEEGAVTINYGVFITKLVTFLIIAFVVFMLCGRWPD